MPSFRIRSSLVVSRLILVNNLCEADETESMAKLVKTIRNNWKKSVLFSGIAIYAANYGKRMYEYVGYYGLFVRQSHHKLQDLIFLSIFWALQLESTRKPTG